MSIANELGPVEYIVVEFPGNRFSGEIIPALMDLVNKGTVHIIDLIVIHKAADGAVTFLEYDALDEEEAALFEGLDFDVEGLVSEEDLLLAAEAMAPNSTAALLIWENIWAADFARAVRNAHGRVLAGDRIPHAIVAEAVDYAAAVLASASANG